MNPGNEIEIQTMKSKAKVYLSGPIFTLGEIAWAGKIKAEIEERLCERLGVFWPYEISAGSKEEVYRENIRSLDGCDLLVAILDVPQVNDGIAWERGPHVARGRKVLGVRTDLRRAGEFRSSRVNAMIESSCIRVKDSEELLAELERLLR